MISFRGLSPLQFEEFTYDLLREMGFKNLSWRKGTGLSGGSSDSGRDIEAVLPRSEIDGVESMEQWYIECKHYEKGVPPSALEGAFAWAEANRPDVLAFVVSGFLSNPAKDYIEKRRAATPRYRIKLWEQKDLDGLTQPHLVLRAKYGLPTDVPFLNLVHPNHLLYALKPQFTTTEYLLECMSGMEPEFRDKIFGTVFLYTVNPRMRKPKNSSEPLSDTILDAVDFEAFCRVCKGGSTYFRSPSFGRNVVAEALSWAFHVSDSSDLPRVRQLYRDKIEISRKALSAPRASERVKKMLLRSVEHAVADEQQLEDRLHRNRQDYVRFCETTLVRLLSEAAVGLQAPYESEFAEVQEMLELIREVQDER